MSFSRLGFAIPELLVGIFVLATLTVAIASLAVVGTRTAVRTEQSVVAQALVKEKIEQIVDMPYEDVGCIPDPNLNCDGSDTDDDNCPAVLGTIACDEPNLNRNNQTFNRTTLIVFVDDALTNTEDEDYKQVQVSVEQVTGGSAISVVQQVVTLAVPGGGPACVNGKLLGAAVSEAVRSGAGSVAGAVAGINLSAPSMGSASSQVCNDNNDCGGDGDLCFVPIPTQAPCVTTADCNGNFVCNPQGNCDRPPPPPPPPDPPYCTTDAECGSGCCVGRACQADCDTCDTNADCSEGLVCIDGECRNDRLPPLCSEVACPGESCADGNGKGLLINTVAGGPCGQDSQCTANEICGAGGTCTPIDQCPCDAGEYCDTAKNVCRPSEPSECITPNAVCPTAGLPGIVVSQGQLAGISSDSAVSSTVGGGQVAGTTSQTAGICSDPCETCPDGWECKSGACQPPDDPPSCPAIYECDDLTPCPHSVYNPLTCELYSFECPQTGNTNVQTDPDSCFLADRFCYPIIAQIDDCIPPPKDPDDEEFSCEGPDPDPRCPPPVGYKCESCTDCVPETVTVTMSDFQYDGGTQIGALGGVCPFVEEGEAECAGFATELAPLTFPLDLVRACHDGGQTEASVYKGSVKGINYPCDRKEGDFSCTYCNIEADDLEKTDELPQVCDPARVEGSGGEVLYCSVRGSEPVDTTDHCCNENGGPAGCTPANSQCDPLGYEEISLTITGRPDVNDADTVKNTLFFSAYEDGALDVSWQNEDVLGPLTCSNKEFVLDGTEFPLATRNATGCGGKVGKVTIKFGACSGPTP